MIEIQLRPGERRILFSPVGLELVDDFTAGPPLGKIEATLSRKDGNDWIPLDVKPIRTLSGLLVYPGLGRHPFPVNGEPKRSFRIQLQAEFYRGCMLVSHAIVPPSRGIAFAAPAFNDGAPPPKPVRARAFLLPAPNYPYPVETPVLRGKVVVNLATKQPVVDAVVADDNRQRVLSDERGEYALPMRFAAPGAPIPIDVTKGAIARSITVKFPDDFGKNKFIVFP